VSRDPARAPIYVHTGNDVARAEDARIPVLDHGFLYGDSVYDVIRTANARPFMMQAHLDRLRRSAALIYFELPWSDAEIAARIEAVKEKIGDDEAYFRIVATRGPGPISLLPDGCTEPGLYIIGCKLITYDSRQYDEGCRVRIVPRQRNPKTALDPSAKTGNYLNNMLGLIEAQREGDEDALFLNAAGDLTEATTANLWIVEGGAPLTPPLAAGLLPGITRDWVFAARDDAREERIDRARLDAADEVFLTGTIKGVMPVSRIDGVTVGAGRPGPVTQALVGAYDAELSSN
jgi:branched-chain amino acid aminotransferase